MANKYWVGGAGTWNTTLTTNWRTTSGGSTVAAVPTAADSVIFDANSGSGGTFTVTMTGALACLDITVSTGGFVTFNTGTTPTLSVASNMAIDGGTVWNSTGIITFTATTAKTVSTNGAVINAPVTFNGTGGTWQLLSNFSVNSTSTVTLTAGTLNLNGFTLTTGLFSSASAVARTIAFGTGNIVCSGTGTVWTTATVTGLTVTGTPNVNITNSTTSAVTVASGICTEAQSFNFNFAPTSAAAYTLTFLATASYTARNVTFTSNFTGTWAATSTCTIYGNLYLGSSMTLTSSASAMTLGGVTSLSKTITSNNKTIPFPITFSGTGSTWVLQDIMTVGTLLTTTLTSGVLNLNDYNLITGIFSSSGAVARTIAFGSAGTNKISCIFNGATGTTVFTTATATLLTVTGTYPLVQVITDAATTPTYTVASGPSSLGAEANAFSFYFQGTFNLTFLATAGYVCKDVDFGYYGSLAGTWTATSTGTIYGNVMLGPNMALTTSASAMTLGATSGTKTFKSNGKSIPFPITLNAPGSTLQLTDAFTMSTVALLFTHTAGTLDLNAVTCTVGTYATGVGTKSLVFNGGNLYISGSGVTAFNNANPLNYTISPGGSYGYMSFTSTTAKTCVGGGSNFDCYFINGGSGALTVTGNNTFTSYGIYYTNLITGSNSFKAIVASGPTRVVTLTAGTTQTITVSGGWQVAGSAGDLTTINSAIAGTVAIIARNYTVNDANYGGSTDYVSLKDINFTPSTTDHTGGLPNIWWAGSHSTNLGNNFGVTFTDWSGLLTTSIKAYYISNTSTTSWTTPADWNPANNIVHMIGGGGGGGGSRATSTVQRGGGGGGGGGGYTKVINYSAAAGTPITIAIGAAGGAGAAQANGTAGGTTTFDTYTAGGGSFGGGTLTPSLTSFGGTGGTGTTYNGGAGASGGTQAGTNGCGGGGGGGAAGPNGTGGAGGSGTFSGTAAQVSGGGGGGNSGGAAGNNGSTTLSGKGGNNFSGSGGGAGVATGNGNGGTSGGGGSGSQGASTTGGGSAPGIDILNTLGGSGGGGGSSGSAVPGATVSYGGGGGGGGHNVQAGINPFAGMAGGRGLIVIQYYPLVLSPGTPGVGSGFFAFF